MKWLISSLESFQKGDIPDTVKAFLRRYPDPFIIMDESSKIKTNSACKEEKKSNRTRAIQKLNAYGERTILTGTFMSVSPVNAYDQMEFLCKGFWGEDMYSFENRYCIMVTLPIGRGIRTLIDEKLWKSLHARLVRANKKSEEDLEYVMLQITKTYRIPESRQRIILENEKYTPFIRLNKLYERIADCSMIVRKEDVLDLPDKVPIKLSVELTAEQKALYKEILNEGSVGDLVLDSLSMYHRLLDVCNGYRPVKVGTKISPKTGKEVPVVELFPLKENPKLDTLIDYMEEIDTKRHQVVIWSNRKRFLHDTFDRLKAAGYRIAKYDGDTTEEEKEELERAFKAKEIDIFIGNQKSGSHGLDWLKLAKYSFFISNDPSPDTRSQAEDRVHRGGCGTEKKAMIDLVGVGSIDERTQASLARGIALIKSGKTNRDIFELEEDDE